jgi:hypothetical protein
VRLSERVGEWPKLVWCVFFFSSIQDRCGKVHIVKATDDGLRWHNSVLFCGRGNPSSSVNVGIVGRFIFTRFFCTTTVSCSVA